MLYVYYYLCYEREKRERRKEGRKEEGKGEGRWRERKGGNPRSQIWAREVAFRTSNAAPALKAKLRRGGFLETLSSCAQPGQAQGDPVLPPNPAPPSQAAIAVPHRRGAAGPRSPLPAAQAVKPPGERGGLGWVSHAAPR